METFEADVLARFRLKVVNEASQARARDAVVRLLFELAESDDLDMEILELKIAPLLGAKAGKVTPLRIRVDSA